jgi:hypothetical protein
MISWELLIVFVQEYDSKRIKSASATKTGSRKVALPSPIFVQVFIPMGLGLTIWRSYAGGKLAVLFVGEEKTPGAQSRADSAVSRKPKDSTVRREAEVWFSANMCDYNK